MPHTPTTPYTQIRDRDLVAFRHPHHFSLTPYARYRVYRDDASPHLTVRLPDGEVCTITKEAWAYHGGYTITPLGDYGQAQPDTEAVGAMISVIREWAHLSRHAEALHADDTIAPQVERLHAVEAMIDTLIARIPVIE